MLKKRLNKNNGGIEKNLEDNEYNTNIENNERWK